MNSFQSFLRCSHIYICSVNSYKRSTVNHAKEKYFTTGSSWSFRHTALTNKQLLGLKFYQIFLNVTAPVLYIVNYVAITLS